MQATTDPVLTRTLVASTPGGLARQYRVQFLPPGEKDWQLFASFKKREPAVTCAQDLQSRGITARILAFRMCPTAA